tara:strand:+ start:516 stop:713 length:198 start_codon:yes stop_codon:yes gene_type:complete
VQIAEFPFFFNNKYSLTISTKPIRERASINHLKQNIMAKKIQSFFGKAYILLQDLGSGAGHAMRN